MPSVPARVPPKKLSREPSRDASKLRLRGWGRARLPSLSCEMSDRGVVISFDFWGDGSLLVEDDEF